jgi:hypothetical protein
MRPGVASGVPLLVPRVDPVQAGVASARIHEQRRYDAGERVGCRFDIGLEVLARGHTTPVTSSTARLVAPIACPAPRSMLTCAITGT